MKKLLILAFVVSLAYAWNSGKLPKPQPEQAKAVETVTKPARLKPYEPHPKDSAEMAAVRADYAARCTGPTPIGYTKQMCDQLLYGINKVDFAQAALGLACVIGKSESYACREALEK